MYQLGQFVACAYYSSSVSKVNFTCDLFSLWK